ncbi:DUF4192 domain-containing protein [Thalassiella azotivora]
MSTPTIRVSEPRDLLAVVPYQLGYVPTDSLVLMSLRGPRQRVGLVARADLPDRSWPRHEVESLCGTVAGHLRRDGARAAVLVVYADPGRTLPQDVGAPADDRAADDRAADDRAADVVALAAAALAEHGIPLLDAWWVGGGRYRCLTCAGDCCPADGRPLDEVRDSQAQAELVYRGLSVASGRGDLLGDLSPAAASVRRAVREAALRPGAVPPQDTADLVRWRQEVLRTWSHRLRAGDGTGGSGERAVDGDVDVAVALVQDAALLAGLADPVLRDAMMLACAPGAGDGPERLLSRGAGDREAGRLLDRVFGARDPLRPERARLEAAGTVLRHLVRVSDGPEAAPPLAVLAWMSWWAGDGAPASDLCDLALAADPGHSLAGLLRRCLDGGIPPGWAEADRQRDLQVARG